MQAHNLCSVCIYKGVLDPFFVGFRHHRVEKQIPKLTEEGGCDFVVCGCCRCYVTVMTLPLVLSWAWHQCVTFVVSDCITQELTRLMVFINK